MKKSKLRVMRRMIINNSRPIDNEGPLAPTINIKCAAKATADETGPPKLTFQGYSGAPVDLTDYGFDYPVVYNIAGIETKQTIPILYNHDEAVGHTTSIRKVEQGSALRGKGIASLPGNNTTRIVEGIKNGFPWEGSMGLRINNWKDDIQFHEKGTVTVNNRTLAGPIYVVSKSTLREMTVTESGRDSDTSFEFLNQEKRMLIKNAAPPADTTPPVPPTPPAPPVVPPTPPVNNNLPPDPTPTPPTPPAPPTPPVKNALDAGTRRAMSLLNKHPGHWDLIEKGLDNGWDDESIDNSVKLHLLNNGLPRPPAPAPKDKQDALVQQLHVNLAMSFGLKAEFLAKKFDKKLVDNADARPQMGIQELLINAANASGGNFQGYSDSDEVCKFLKNTGYSTFDLPDFFQKVAGTMKEARWELNPPFAPTICKEGSNKDFRKTQRMRLTGGDVIHEVADDGKLELYAAGKQVKYETDLQTYGAIFMMTRKEVANDDMDALTDMMNMMVEGFMTIPDTQWGKLAIQQAPAAGTFWVDDDNSFDNTPLTRANLSTAWNAIRQYNEAKATVNWNVLASERWSLVISPNLEEAAWDIIKQDRIVNDTTANTKTGDKNFWFGKFDIKVFGQMANTSLFGSTSDFVGNTTWMLVPSSTRFAPWEITYFRGRKTPVIENVDLPATLLGFGTRGYWDVKINERERTLTSRYTATA